MVSMLTGLGMAGWGAIASILVILSCLGAWQHGRGRARRADRDAMPARSASARSSRGGGPGLAARALSDTPAAAKRGGRGASAPDASMRGGFAGEDGPSPIDAYRAAIAERVEAFAQARGSTVIKIVHHDYDQYVDTDTAIEAIDLIRHTPADAPVDVILHTPGGIASATQQILHALKQHKGRKTAFVPYRAKSAGTMIALACDEIVMGTSAVLGPIDPQYFWMPAPILADLPSQKSADRMNDETLILSKMAQQAVTEARRFACEFVNEAHRKDGTCAITDDLIGGGRNHDYPILPHEAVKFGLNVSTAMPEAGYAICQPPPKDDPVLVVSMFNTQKDDSGEAPALPVFR